MCIMDPNTTIVPCAVNCSSVDVFRLSSLTKGIRVAVGTLVLVENLLCLIVLHKSKSLQLALRYFLVNLATSDMLSGAIFIYQSAVLDLSSFNDVSAECKIRTMLVSYITITTTTTVTALSVERVIALFKPFKYRLWITKNALIAILLFVWIFPLVVVLSAYEISSDLALVCHISELATTRTYLTLSGTRFGLVIITVICQILMFYAARSHIRKIVPTLVGSHHSLTVVRMHLKATLTTALLVIPFIVCVLPLYGGYLYLGVNPHTQTLWGWKVFMSFGLTLFMANGVLNPVIYCWRLTPVRRSLKNLCCGSIGPQHPGTSSIT